MGQTFVNYVRGEEGVPFYGCYFPWEVRERWSGTENVLSLPM